MLQCHFYTAGLAEYITLGRKVLVTQFLFFVPLAIGATCIAWFAAGMSRARTLSAYALLSAALWIASSLALFLVITVATPRDGVRHIPTVLGAYSAPFLAIAAVLYSLGERWSREPLVLLALAASAVAAMFSPMLLLSAVCIIQANCL